MTLHHAANLQSRTPNLGPLWPYVPAWPPSLWDIRLRRKEPVLDFSEMVDYISHPGGFSHYPAFKHNYVNHAAAETFPGSRSLKHGIIYRKQILQFSIV